MSEIVTEAAQRAVRALDRPESDTWCRLATQRLRVALEGRTWQPPILRRRRQ